MYKGKRKNGELHDLHPLADLARINQQRRFGLQDLRRLADLARINQQRRFGLQDLHQVADLVTVGLFTIMEFDN